MLSFARITLAFALLLNNVFTGFLDVNVEILMRNINVIKKLVTLFILAQWRC